MAREDMNYWRLQPDARLRPWILCYWMVEPAGREDSRNASSADAQQLLMPDGHSELVFRLAGSFTRWRIEEPAKRTQMCASYLIGGRAHSVMTRSMGGLRLAGVKMDPRAARAMIRMPLAELRDTTVACTDLGCKPLTDLEDAVANAGSAELLAGVFDRFFLQRLSDEALGEPAIESLVQRIRATRGSQSILQWARDQGVDPRTLERRFVASMGMTPKQYSRIVRFKHSYRRLTTRQPDDRKMHLDPYYDESHFSREFKHFLGTSPVKWLNDTANYRTTIGDHLLEAEFSAR